MTVRIQPPDLAILDIPALAARFPSLLAEAVRAVPCTVAPHLFATRAHSDATVHAAQRLCRGCPLRDACAAYACHHDEVGIWGGTTERDRRCAQRRAGGMA